MLCDDNISDKAISIIIFGIYFLIFLKILLICCGICTKLLKKQIRPENEYLRNLILPLYIPSFAEHDKRKQRQKKALLHRFDWSNFSSPNTIQTEQSDTMDIGKSYYAYYRLQDWRKNRNVCCRAMEYIFIFIVYLFKLIIWCFKTAFWIILLFLNFVCSMLLFYIHHSPVLGIDNLDFCTDSQMNENALTKSSCDIATECGIANFIILPNVTKYLLPRYITLSISC